MHEKNCVDMCARHGRGR